MAVAGAGSHEASLAPAETRRKGHTPDATSGRRSFPLVALMLPLLLLVMWQIGVSNGMLKTAIASTPGQVLGTLVELLTNGVMAKEFLSSLMRIAWGLGIGLLLGLGLGILTGYLRGADRALDPTLRGLNAVPAVGWIPFLILSLGIGDASKVALIAIATFFPIYVNAYAGIRSTDQKLIELATAYHLPRSRVVRSVVIPAALPQIMVGVRIAVAVSWVVATVSEIVYGNRGLGVLLNDGRSLARPDQMIAVMIVLAFCGKVSDAIVVSIGRRYTSWQSTLDGMAPYKARVIDARSRP